MLEKEALELYDIDQKELDIINEFCEKYILNCKFNIIDLMYYDGLLVKTDSNILQLAKDNIININNNFYDVIENFSKKAIYELIPNIKDVFININVPFKKSINADNLRFLISDNKTAFESYFNNYAIATLSKDIKNFINKYQDYIEEYANITHTPGIKNNDKKYAEYKYSYETYNKPTTIQYITPKEDIKKTEAELNPLPFIFGIIIFFAFCIFIGANL